MKACLHWWVYTTYVCIYHVVVVALPSVVVWFGACDIVRMERHSNLVILGAVAMCVCV